MKQICAIFLRMQNVSGCHFIDEDIPVNPMIAIEHKRRQNTDHWTVARIKCPRAHCGTSASHFLSSSIAEFYRWNSVVGSTSVDCD
jgi:hypothetical protein